MVTKHNKRALENGNSCQPVKYHKQLDYSFDQTLGIMEVAPNKISIKSDVQQAKDIQFLSSPSVTSLSEGIDCDEGASLLRKDEDTEELVNNVEINNDGYMRTELVHSQNSVCGCKEEQCIDSQASIQTEEMEAAVLANETSGGESNLCEDGFQSPQERVLNIQQAKDFETCMSVSSIGNSSRSTVSEVMDAQLVSASSPSSKDKMCDFDTIDQDSRGSDKIDPPVPPSFGSESGDFCFRTCAEFDFNGGRYSHCESSTGFGGYYRKKVPIGPEFQAELPVCRPQAYMASSDSSGLMESEASLVHTDDGDGSSNSLIGYRVWPLAASDDSFDDCSIGQGRSTDCGCPDSTSIRCVKEHIEVEREKLKLKLGEAFCLWGFDDMGENVSEKWTRQEEETFWELVSMNPMSSNKNFWNYLPMAFPSKSKKELVSYYFNVFVLRRRALQNRVDPDNIDSDDDEEDWRGSEIGLNDRLMMTDDDDSDVESDSTEGGDEVAESDEEMADTTEEEDEVAASYMAERHTTNRTNHKIFFCDQENQVVDSEDENSYDATGEFSFPLEHRLDQNNHRDLVGGQDLQDESFMSMEWNHEGKSSGLICIRTAGVHAVQEEKFKEVTSSDGFGKEKQTDLHYGNEMLCGDGKPNGNISRKDEFVIDGHPSLLEPYDSKLWDVALMTSLKTDTDRFVSTCSLIKELFGDESRENDKNKS